MAGKTIATLSLLLLAATSCGCGASVSDGTRSGPPAPPRRIISVVPNATEILFKLGLGDRVVAVSSYCNFPPQALHLPRVGDSQTVQLERVVALRPDLIIAMPTSGNRAYLDRLEQLGIRSLHVQIRGIDDIFAAIRSIAGACQVAPDGERLVNALQTELERVRRLFATRTPVRTLFVVDREPLVVAGAGSYIDELIALAGGDNIARDSPVPYPPYSMEDVLSRKPQVIIDTAFNSEPGSEEVARVRAGWERWSSLPAVHNGRIVCTRDTALFVPGPRLIEGLHHLCEILHPGVLATGSAERP